MSAPLLLRALTAARRGIRSLFLLNLPARAPAAALEQHRAGELLRRPARRLGWRGESLPALVLLREAAAHLARSKLAASEQSIPTDAAPPEVVSQLVHVMERGAERVPLELERARHWLANAETLPFNAWSRDELATAAEDLEEATRFLAGLVDTRSARRVRLERGLRIGLAGLLAVVLAFGAVQALPRRNLALHRPVSASPAAYATSPQAVVDGVRFGELGYHSEMQQSPWLVVDLGRNRELTGVRVYGRADCCYDQSLPLLLEVSSDGRDYQEVSQRNEAFSAYEPWDVELDRTTARFVRLRARGHSYLVVAEVEVFGRRR